MNNFFTKLETIEPRSTEVIVLYFDSDCSLDELENIGKTIQEKFVIFEKKFYLIRGGNKNLILFLKLSIILYKNIENKKNILYNLKF